MANTIMVNHDPNDKHDNDIVGNLTDMAKYLGSVATQLSVYSTELGTVKADLNEVKTDVANIRTDYGDRIKVLEEDEALKPYMVNNISKAVRIRVAELLDIRFDKRGGAAEGYERVYKRYYGKFCQRLHNDAKHEGIEAGNWRFTPRKHYQKLIEFINDWVPARGVEGLKSYYDSLEEA